MRLLVTRPEPDAQRTAALLRQRGHHVMMAPLLRIEGIAADIGTGPWDALVITSANSCRAVAKHPRIAELVHRPIFTVGLHSAEAARKAGFFDVIACDGDVEELAEMLTEKFKARDRRLLYFAGEDRTADLAAGLAAHGIQMKTIIIYRAVKMSDFPPLVREAMAAGEIDGVLHFSRRTSESYLSSAVGAALLDRALAPFHYCLSAQVARPLLQAGATAVRVAERPNEASLVELIGMAV
jgi:uroporphyrinogen-III synthase